MENKKIIAIESEKISAIEKIIAKIAVNIKSEICLEENRILLVATTEPGIQPRNCAEIVMRNGGNKLDGNRVITKFKACQLGNPKEREHILQVAGSIASDILQALQQNNLATATIESINKRLELNRQLGRLSLLNLFAKSPQLQNSKSFAQVLLLTRDYARFCLDEIIIYLSSEFSPLNVENTKKTIAEYEKELFRLDASLNRAYAMINRLRNEFEEQAEEIRLEEAVNIISKLNSAQYGYILDLLVINQNGLKALRQEKVNLPLEINGMPILIRKLLQFVEDCGITAITEVGKIKFVTATDIENCNYDYEGTAFQNETEVKKVEVFSAGWQIKNKAIIISNPKIREVEE